MSKRGIILFIVLIIGALSTSALAQDVYMPEDAAGLISIPCLDVKMPFYVAQGMPAQQIIDNKQSALFYQWQTGYRIVDHAFSECMNGNEWNIQKVFPGAYATIQIDEQRYLYECYLTAKTDYIGDEEYINGRLITPCSSYDILIGCCAEDADHHFIAVFQRLREF